MESAVYLRKSRMEEGMETEEVLSRHQKALLDHAAKKDIHIIETYYEVVSGESLYARPEMLRLLEDVEEGKYDAVLVMDLDRLSRGRMKDQGIILDAFRDSGTLIITPDKTYDLADDMDDELAEFKTFMSRREYKIINKRLQRGYKQSIMDGYYVSNPPYGYRRLWVDKRPTLEILEEEAKFIRMMFDLYTSGYGCTSIAQHVNLLGARPHRSDKFSRSSVAQIIKNPTYIGKIVWDQKKHIKKGAKGNPKHITIYQPREKWLIVDGVHPPIIERDTYEKAQEIMGRRFIPSKKDGTIKSSLAGLVRCQNCGRNMQRLTMKGAPYLLCVEPGCCASTKFEFVESRILQHLRDILDDLTVQKSAEVISRDTSTMDESLIAVRRELTAAQGQKSRLYELLETGEYDLSTFRERMAAVKEKLSKLDAKEQEILSHMARLRSANPMAQAKKIATILGSYTESDPPQRNALLHSIVQVVWYSKKRKTKPSAFTLQVDLKPF